MDWDNEPDHKLPKLRDTLTGPEKDELRNVMRNEPVFPGNTVSHATAKALSKRGLIRRNSNGWWIANWEAIKNGNSLK